MKTAVASAQRFPGRSAPAAGDGAPWGGLIAGDQWPVLLAGARALEAADAEFLLAGALALASCTGRWRDTKDVDVVVRPRDADAAVAALRRAGFEDYFAQQAYDRSWIFRGWKDGVLFDVIWELPNHRLPIDDTWFERAREVSLRGLPFAVVPPEEVVRMKLYVMQRERCDWVDVLNVLASTVDEIDWAWLVDRMGRDCALLHGVLAIFNWLCPGRALALPAWVRERFALEENPGGDLAEIEARRVRLLDSRPWFAPHQPADRPLER
jgi:hypothetical protein